MVGGYNRDVSYRKAKRKKRIAEQYYSLYSQTGWYDSLHQYSKNQIYCSCPMCTQKTNNKGKNRKKHGNYCPSKNWKHSDLVKISAMEEQIDDYNNDAFWIWEELHKDALIAEQQEAEYEYWKEQYLNKWREVFRNFYEQIKANKTDSIAS